MYANRVAARPAAAGTGVTAAIAGFRDQLTSVWPVMAALWTAAFLGLFYLYISPYTAPPTVKIDGIGHFDFDKLYHLMSHAGLLALPLAIMPNRRLAWVMGGLAIFAAFGFEFCQFYVPSRSFDLDDMAANMAGLVVGALSGRIIREY